MSGQATSLEPKVPTARSPSSVTTVLMRQIHTASRTGTAKVQPNHARLVPARISTTRKVAGTAK